MTSLERFKQHVVFLDDSDDSCWIWTGALRDDGRGRTWVEGRENERRAHRVAWEFLNGQSLPRGMRLVPECSHPQCVRHWRLARRYDAIFPGRRTDRTRDNSGGRACA
jgi:hypothetical protein